MEDAIKILEEAKEKLQVAYFDLVENGDVHPESSVVLENREKVNSCEKALEKLRR